LLSPNTKPGTFVEQALSDSFTETPALSIPKLNFIGDCVSEPCLALPHATHINESLVFRTIQSGQSHEPAGFLNLSPNPRTNVDFEDEVGIDLAINTGLLVSQA
jgi:hypothetical protein